MSTAPGPPSVDRPHDAPRERLRERLKYQAAGGVLHDGPRRYLLMRPDSLMGALRSLDPLTRETVFEALAQSVLRHGSDSLRAYAASVKGDPQALVQATVDAAADLGWGQWTVRHRGESLQVLVQHSPFAAGWLAVDPHREPAPPTVCAPIRGMLAALAGALGWPSVRVQELSCAAQGHTDCRFIAEQASAVGAP